jgi:hypothetical protein
MPRHQTPTAADLFAQFEALDPEERSRFLEMVAGSPLCPETYIGLTLHEAAVLLHKSKSQVSRDAARGKISAAGPRGTRRRLVAVTDGLLNLAIKTAHERRTPPEGPVWTWDGVRALVRHLLPGACRQDAPRVTLGFFRSHYEAELRKYEYEAESRWSEPRPPVWTWGGVEALVRHLLPGASRQRAQRVTLDFFRSHYEAEIRKYEAESRGNKARPPAPRQKRPRVRVLG